METRWEVNPGQDLVAMRAGSEEEERMKNDAFKKELIEIDGGRFKDLINSLTSLSVQCKECSTFNPKAEDAYMCAVAGSCPGATLCAELLSYLRMRTGLCTEAEHRAFLSI